MLEIKLHDGPARLGKHMNNTTPHLLKFDPEMMIRDEPMPYDVPLEMASWSVANTIGKAKKGDCNQMAVIQGSKYPDLRIECANSLEKLGFRLFLVANSEELLRRPRDLLNIIISLRKAMNPNSALYFPFTKLSFIPLLAYMGIDLFGEPSADYYAHIGILTTPDHDYDLEKYPIYDLNPGEIKNYNRKSLDFVLREVRAHIKNGTLRNLVEERCCSSPEAMSALRILDRDHGDYLESYTQLY
ncbi:MAG: archaeosine tRNA-ribosyltransferase [Methanobacterium sp.]|jgi:predicted RNA-binding protein